MKYLALYENFITDLFKKSKKDDYVRDIFLPKAFEIGDHVRIKNKNSLVLPEDFRQEDMGEVVDIDDYEESYTDFYNRIKVIHSHQYVVDFGYKEPDEDYRKANDMYGEEFGDFKSKYFAKDLELVPEYEIDAKKYNL